MTRWLLSWATAAPVEAAVVGFAVLVGCVTVGLAVMAARAYRRELAEDEDWMGEGGERHW